MHATVSFAVNMATEYIWVCKRLLIVCEVEDLLQLGITEPVHRDWRSTVVLAKKEGWSVIQLYWLCGSHVFWHLGSGDNDNFEFATPSGLWVWIFPIILIFSPGTSQCLMGWMFWGFYLTKFLLYPNDVIISSNIPPSCSITNYCMNVFSFLYKSLVRMDRPQIQLKRTPVKKSCDSHVVPALFRVVGYYHQYIDFATISNVANWLTFKGIAWKWAKKAEATSWKRKVWQQHIGLGKKRWRVPIVPALSVRMATIEGNKVVTPQYSFCNIYEVRNSHLSQIY